MREFRKYILFTSIFFILSSDFGLCLNEVGEVLKIITESYAKHVVAHKRQDAVGAAEIYADDLWMVDDSGFEVKSRKEIEKIYAQNYKSGMVVKELRYTTEKLRVNMRSMSLMLRDASLLSSSPNRI